jgi:formate dehydrogenase maturation protein FdhE
MNCWHCNEELIWGGDDDYEMSDEFDLATNRSCPRCHAYVIVYLKFDDIQDALKNKHPDVH